MTVFTKSINDITYQDVIDFCNNNPQPESIFLDYKADFPPENEKLAKTIAAFANTWGGTLIIGVDESNGKPKPLSEGITYRDKLHERVEDIILGNIRPPVFCKIQVAHKPDKSKAFIIIRIPQSNDEHVLKDEAVYVRKGRSSYPEEVASPEQIEWLMDRRKKSVELREWILFKTEERFSNFCRLHSINQQDLKGLCSFSIIPLYPQRPLVKYYEIPNIAKKIEVNSQHFSLGFPYYIKGAKNVHGGIASFQYIETAKELSCFYELNHFGLFLFKEPVVKETDTQGEYLVIEHKKIVSLVPLFLKTALNFYKELGYWGLLELRLQMENIQGIKPPEVPHADPSFTIVDDKLPWRREFSVKELEDNLENIAVGILHEVLWPVGVRSEEKDIRHRIKKLEPNIF